MQRRFSGTLIRTMTTPSRQPSDMRRASASFAPPGCVAASTTNLSNTRVSGADRAVPLPPVRACGVQKQT